MPFIGCCCCADGARRPPSQSGSKLRFVSDLLALGWATIYESLHLLHWMEEEVSDLQLVQALCFRPWA